MSNALHARVLSRVLVLEAGNGFEKRACTRIKVNKGILALLIRARDAKALKASANHYLKHTELCLGVCAIP